MKIKYILSLFEKYDFPQDFFNMPSEQLVSLHANALGFKLDDILYRQLSDRACYIHKISQYKSIASLIKEEGILIKEDNCIDVKGYCEFSYFVFPEKIININIDALRRLEQSSRKIAGRKISDSVSFKDIAIAHEYCHYIDFKEKYKLGGSGENKKREIIAYLFVKKHLNLNFYTWILDLCYLKDLTENL